MRTLITNLLLFSVLGLQAQQYWRKIPSNTDVRLNAIDFPSSSVGYIGGNDSVLLKTVDGGMTWQPVQHHGITFNIVTKHFLHLNFFDENHGYAIIGDGNLSGTMYKTFDGGSTWTHESRLTFCFPKATYFQDSLNGIVVGLDCFWNETLQRMVSGGFQAVQRLSFNMGQLSCVDFRNNSLGITAGYSNYFYRTTDGGVNWDTIPTVVPGKSITDIAFVNDTLVYATFGEPGSTGLMISKDAGLTWDLDWDGATFFYPGFQTLSVLGDGRCFAGGEPSVPSFPSYGYTLIQYGPYFRYDMQEQKIWDSDTFGDSTVFAVGDSGLIITNGDTSAISIGIEENENFNFQIFPNPATEQAFIQTDWKGPFHVSLFDIHGQLQLKKEMAIQEEHWIDIRHLETGMYLLRVFSVQGTTTLRLIKN